MLNLPLEHVIDDVREKISKNTRAIFHNHYCGYLGYINEINSLGKEFGIPVIDDCIEAFGSELNNHKTGDLGSDIPFSHFKPCDCQIPLMAGLLFLKTKIFLKRPF